MDDEKIVELYLSKDESAIAQTAHKYGSKLRRIADSILNDMSAAEECENDTYFKAWELIPPNEPRTYLFAFLGRIIRHTAIDRCRKNNSIKRQAMFCELTAEMQECIPDNSRIEDMTEVKDLSRIINGYLSNCSQTQCNVFVRRYWFFDSISEICKRYGFSQSKVKTMLFRMREELRTYLEKEGYTV